MPSDPDIDEGALTLLATHFERIKRRLQAEGEAAKSFQHGLNRGQIREVFVREFLTQNISDFWGIGTGEIIHKAASPEEARHQIDVVVHNKKYPKLSLATGIDLFFIETVSSFIEIKSRLTKAELKKSALVAKQVKSVAEFAPQRFNPTGLLKKPRPYSFLFAYGGPKKIETVLNWLKEIAAEGEYGLDALRDTDPGQRSFFDHRFIDGVFVLGRGFVIIDALPFESQIENAVNKGLNVSPREIWVRGSEQELLFLWALINHINARLLWSEENLNEYIGNVRFTIPDACENDCHP